MILTGITVLALGLLVVYKFSYDSSVEVELLHTQSLASETSINIDHLLIDKVETALTLGNTPMLKAALIKSNLRFASLSENQRKQFINLNDKKWRSIGDSSDSFILKFTDNPVSHVIKSQQILLKGEYGEIFLTNQYGALIASTSKLSTYAHGYKYWWRGAYNQGKGTVFLDDRGYDDSVGGYVLGIVIPVRDGDKVIGILKCNLNILSALREHVVSTREGIPGEFKLVRSGGLVVIEADSEPLSTRIPKTIINGIDSNHSGSFIDNSSGADNLIGYSEVSLSKGIGKYRFGGTFESIDHKKGNSGESWYIIYFRPMSEAIAPLLNTYKTVIQLGLAIILILFIVSFLYGRSISKPLNLLTDATIKVRDGDFKSKIELKSNDEFGSLATHFNIMVDKISQMTQNLTDHNNNLEKRVAERTLALSTANQKLQDEIAGRIETQNTLELSEEKYRILFENMLGSFALHRIVLNEKNEPVDYIFIEVNKAFEKQTGLTRDVIIGKPVTEILPGIETDPADWIGIYGKVATGGEELRFEQYSEQLDKWYSVLAYSPKENYFATIFLDITDKKRVENELVEADCIKELLLDIITHDLKNPVSTIYSMSYKAMEDDPENKMIGVILFSSQELLHQLDNVSILSQAALGEAIPVEKLNLRKILKGVVDEFDLALQNAQIIMTMDVASDIVITANPLITQVFKNYLSNAIKYASSGKAIHIEALREKDAIVVRVNDLGETIPDKDRVLIFERHTQIAKGKRLGRGLGLAIVKRIASVHGGEVWVEPNQPKGNKFCLRLPV